MITYRDFITELERLATEGRKLRNAKRMHEDPDFRKWRNELQSLLNQIVQVDYLLPCSVQAHKRSFGYSNRPKTDDELMAGHRRDMDDTINELTVITESFEKHGEPPKGRTSASELETPKVVTLSWLYHHTSVSFWWKIVTVSLAVVVGVFSLGVYFGQNDIYKKAITLFEQKKTETGAKD